MRWLLLFALLLPGFAVNAQSKQISIIEFYGLQSLSEQQIRNVLPIKEGDAFSLATEDAIVKKLKEIPGVSDAYVATTYVGKPNLWRLLIGVSEGNIARAPRHPEPTGAVTLPKHIMKTYSRHFKLWIRGAKKGKSMEDYRNGYYYSGYPPVAKNLDKIIAYVKQDLPHVKNVLLNSKYPEHREAAAWAISYSMDKRAIVPALLHAVRDTDRNVRMHATSAIVLLIRWGRMRPDAQFYIPADPFINMTNSIVWEDRIDGVSVLLALTEGAPENVKKDIGKRTWKSLAEMSRLKDMDYALMSYKLLARLGGMAAEQIETTFLTQYRDSWIRDMVEAIKAY